MAEDERIFVNGIDFETGDYAVRPLSAEQLVARIRGEPGTAKITAARDGALETFAVPLGNLDDLGDVGWGVVFSADCPAEVRDALKPLLDLRQRQAGDLFKVLSYKAGEQTRDWYDREGVSIGDAEPEKVPYYLLLVGSPGQIPFDFQNLLGIDYAVGRLHFEMPADYRRYADSMVAYERATQPTNRKEVAYWGTHHAGDVATELSAQFLVDPLANGISGTGSTRKKPVHEDARYGHSLAIGEDASKARLSGLLHFDKAPALLFTASHGMAVRSGRPNQRSDQGALLCQDWPNFGSTIKPEHIFAAADLTDAANVHGLIAMVFACFGAGTPQNDQFPMDLSDPATKVIAPAPFIAALPQRLLAHPKGGALAVIGHIERAWAYSIKPFKASASHIAFFRNAMLDILTGGRAGRAVSQQFSAKYAALTATLANQMSPGFTGPKFTDRELVSCWIERNDAQNYVLLGDPAVRIRDELVS